MGGPCGPLGWTCQQTVSHKLEALRQTSHLELWTVGAMELLGAPAQPRSGGPVREALEEPWGHCHINGRQGTRSRRWGRRGGKRAQGTLAKKLSRGGFQGRGGRAKCNREVLVK